jgi:hypothetical protein
MNSLCNTKACVYNFHLQLLIFETQSVMVGRTDERTHGHCEFTSDGFSPIIATALFWL